MQKLNASASARIFEVSIGCFFVIECILNSVQVAPGDTLLAGDGILAKANLKFDVKVTGLKPGIWRSIVTPLDDERHEVKLVWVQDGHVDYASLPENIQVNPTPEADDEDHAEWEKLGGYSVDSGISTVIVRSAFDVLVTPEREQEDVMEVFMDACYDNIGNGFPAIPGGVSFGGNDGGYKVSGRRDVDEALVKIRVLT